MKRIVVLGAGESGAGAAVLAKVKGFDVFVSDLSAIKDKYKQMLDSRGIAWEEGHHTESLILNADEVIKSPGIPNDAPMVLRVKEKGIPVTNVPTYGTASVGQFAIALLLEICHHIGHHDETVKAGKWERCADWCYWDYPLIELAGKTYGLLGCGNIGVHTAAIASALGMHVIAYDTRQREEALALGVEYVELDDLFARSDVLGLQMPLFPFNTGIINKENIAKMKDGVIIINNSRGQMVVEQDLADALNSGKVAAAGLDVVSTEPIRGDNPLLKAKNCILTPHISWAPKESRQRIMDCTVDNVRAYLAGKPINVVNG